MHPVPEHYRQFRPGFQPDWDTFGKFWKLSERSRHGDENHRQQQAHPEKPAQDGGYPRPGKKRIDDAPAHDRPGHDSGGQAREAYANDQDFLAADHALESTIQVDVNIRNRTLDQEPSHAEHGREAAQAIGDARYRREQTAGSPLEARRKSKEIQPAVAITAAKAKPPGIAAWLILSARLSGVFTVYLMAIDTISIATNTRCGTIMKPAARPTPSKSSQRNPDPGLPRPTRQRCSGRPHSEQADPGS